MPGVKISGITNTEDAKWAAILGVEFISMSLTEGDPRKISPDMASQISRMLPSYTSVVAECGRDFLRPSVLKKIEPAFLEFPAYPENTDAQEETVFNGERLISDVQLAGLADRESAAFVQLRVSGPLSDESLEEIKGNFKAERLIIEGDLELPDIKKICERIQPYAWSVREAITKSPRKIDYGKMKQYIREISLW